MTVWGSNSAIISQPRFYCNKITFPALFIFNYNFILLYESSLQLSPVLFVEQLHIYVSHMRAYCRGCNIKISFTWAEMRLRSNIFPERIMFDIESIQLI